MAFRMLKQNQGYIEQDTNDENERPRWFECFSCVMLRTNIMKINPDEPRYKCLILDIENAEIERRNEEMINPSLKKPLKKCPIHGSEVEE